MTKEASATLKQKISSFENLFFAYRECSKGKRSSAGFQNCLFGVGEELIKIQRLLESDSFEWQAYREFYVKDPKRRRIQSATFLDRVVHHALHRHLEPIVDSILSNSVFACRKNMGNRKAVQTLWNFTKDLGPNRFCIKLDVAGYFQSIDQRLLYETFTSILPDDSLNGLLFRLIRLGEDGCGIPIGNLTSQLFANFFLSPVDNLVLNYLDMRAD